MTRNYISKCGCIGLEYIDGVLNQLVVLNEDRVDFDALRHDIELYEDDINTDLFEQH